jgi:hypothetical protein
MPKRSNDLNCTFRNWATDEVTGANVGESSPCLLLFQQSPTELKLAYLEGERQKNIAARFKKSLRLCVFAPLR